jgi:hypothetical protein
VSSFADTRSRRRGRTRRRTLVISVVGVMLAFAIGVALGEALHDNPAPGGAQTLVRTLEPLQLPPAARTTVTVTVTNP